MISKGRDPGFNSLTSLVVSRTYCLVINILTSGAAAQWGGGQCCMPFN